MVKCPTEDDLFSIIVGSSKYWNRSQQLSSYLQNKYYRIVNFYLLNLKSIAMINTNKITYSNVYV